MKIKKSGFTLLEFLLVIVIFGLVLSIVLPRAMRAMTDARFNQVRQYGSEIASYTIQWAQQQVESQRENSPYSVKDYFMENVESSRAGGQSFALIDKYTGDDDFNGVEMLVPPEKMQKNPFNGVSYFNEVNDDEVFTPSPKPGLLFFVSGIDPAIGERSYRNFYLIYTGGAGRWFKREANWHAQMDDEDEDAIRRGIFVSRQPDAQRP